MPTLVPVILSGGAGTRLWPLSRELHPKQLIALLGRTTLLQDTAQRAASVAATAPPLVVCNAAHRFMVAEQLREVGITPGAILLEPVGRNTAPAIAAAAAEAIARHGEDVLLLVLPADHVIRGVERFTAAVGIAAEVAAGGAHVTFGVVPTRAETGFGYIEAGAAEPVPGARRARAFVEKPERAVAERFLASGNHYWNSGMFVFAGRRFLEDLARFEPEMAACARDALARAERDPDFIRLEPDAFAAAPASSVDYALMERTERTSVVPLDAQWDDVGSWSALWTLGERDGQGNVIRGDVLAHATRSCYLRAESRLLATVGIDDLVVVETADAVLVAARDAAQDVKQIAEHLRMASREEHVGHPLMRHPWGSIERIARGTAYEVRRLRIRPGGKPPAQAQLHEGEHWSVVAGTARVHHGDGTYVLARSESTSIPAGERHHAENAGPTELEMIGVCADAGPRGRTAHAFEPEDEPEDAR